MIVGFKGIVCPVLIWVSSRLSTVRLFNACVGFVLLVGCVVQFKLAHNSFQPGQRKI